jgi:hypothetical protein
MKDIPILFSAPMVRAILAGTKTQTRRAVKPVGNDEGFVLQDYGRGPVPYRSGDGESSFYRDSKGYDIESPIACPYGKPGDRLWVRETWCRGSDERFLYRADPRSEDLARTLDAIVRHACRGWKPSIHMPRAASRITLEVTGVRIERLQDISGTDAKAEGIVFSNSLMGWHVEDGTHFHCHNPCQSYLSLWEAINGPGSVEANPWVWAIEFRRA